jgi:GR25 family glycosyltransferase involved in LPS biosynthesis
MAAGNVGCTMSHIRCLELAKSREWPHVFICEDDILFKNVDLFRANLAEFLNTRMPWDVIIVGGNSCPPYSRIAANGAPVDFCIKVKNVQTTTGYIVAAHYYDTLIQNFKEGLNLLLRNPHQPRLYAIDMYWKSLQPEGNWYMITPATVTQRTDYSDIECRAVNYDHLMLDTEKTALIQQYNNWIAAQKNVPGLPMTFS